MDDNETQKKFKAELKAPFIFIADPKGEIVKKYDVKMPVVSVANRVTFVIGQDGKVAEIQKGSDAIDPSGAIVACPLHKPH